MSAPSLRNVRRLGDGGGGRKAVGNAERGSADGGAVGSGRPPMSKEVGWGAARSFGGEGGGVDCIGRMPFADSSRWSDKSDGSSFACCSRSMTAVHLAMRGSTSDPCELSCELSGRMLCAIECRVSSPRTSNPRRPGPALTRGEVGLSGVLEMDRIASGFELAEPSEIRENLAVAATGVDGSGSGDDRDRSSGGELRKDQRFDEGRLGGISRYCESGVVGSSSRPETGVGPLSRSCGGCAGLIAEKLLRSVKGGGRVRKA